MSRCMMLAALLFNPHRARPRVTITRPDRNTVWIDEVADITPAQARLIERWFERPELRQHP